MFAVRRSWPGALRVLPAVLKHLQYQTDGEALVVVADSDKSPVHEPAHDQPHKADLKCRLCCLRQAAASAQLRRIPGRAPIKLAFGLAVPEIEAWYLCGRDPHVSEANWILGLRSRQFPYDKNGLKKAVYGTERPTISLETQCALDAARRLVQDLAELETWFPAGFGALADDIRNW
jgi:hypothetical protein